MNTNTAAAGPLYFRHIAENKYTGAQRWELSQDAARVVFDWIRQQGQDPADVVRGMRWTQGRVRFTTGVGYSILDADLLGGDGSGQTLRRFTEDTGAHLECVRGRRTAAQLASW